MQFTERSTNFPPQQAMSKASFTDTLPRLLLSAAFATLAPNSQSHAKEAPQQVTGDAVYLLIDPANEPYTWRLSDGEVLIEGLSDARGRVALVPRAGRQDYVLEMLWGKFPVHVPPACWSKAPAQFQHCVRISPVEPTAQQHGWKQAERRRHEESVRLREDGVAWVNKTLSVPRALELLHDTLEDQNKWRKTPAASLNVVDFSCRPPLVPIPSAAAEAAFEKARGILQGQRNSARRAYIEAAQLGHWRAAARLASVMLEDEEWASASMVIAWLLKHKVPAGYNKLADLHALISRYEDGQMNSSNQSLVLSLRWRAAQLGDPLAQIAMASHFEKARKPALVEALTSCARTHNPELWRVRGS